jgi:sigma54-dependent transcription regulator
VKGTLLGSVQISSTGDWGKYQDFSGGLKAPEENVDLYLHMTGGNHMMNVNWFEFR